MNIKWEKTRYDNERMKYFLQMILIDFIAIAYGVDVRKT